MNVNDIQTEAPEDGDMLENMFGRQWDLELKYRPMEANAGYFITHADPDHDFPVDLHNGHAQILVKDGMERVIEELMEAANTLKNKPWKQTHVLTDITHFDEELMDALHFFLRLFLIRYGPRDAAKAVYRMYFKKSEVNKFRQESKY